MDLEFDTLHDQIAEICRRYRIAELSVFGSVTRREDSFDSDIDLLYVSAPDSTNSLWELWELRDELEQLLGRKVDLVPKNSLHWVIRDRVLAEARPVYAA
jgi:predicted nucleotidyltransferase